MVLLVLYVKWYSFCSAILRMILGLTLRRREYLASLKEYLESFYTRTQPLQSLQKLYKSLEDFDEQFEAGKVPDWEDRGEGQQAISSEGQIDLHAFDSTEELLTIGESALLPPKTSQKSCSCCNG